MGTKTPMEMAENKERVFDQTASMHFKLSDEYKLKYTFEDAVEIVFSIFLCGITFLDSEKYFHISEEISTLMMGFAPVFLLAFTLVKQRLNHKQLYEKHHLAGKMYVQAKLNLVSKIIEWKNGGTEICDTEILEYMDSHFTALNDLPQIPEKHFNRLKHIHQCKVAFSKYLDDHQDDFWLICRIKFRLKMK